MGKALISLMVIILVFSDQVCYAQTAVTVSDPRLELKDNKLFISYDILDGIPGEKYIVEVEIKDENGKNVKAKSLEGDIGEIDTGGFNKQITWDLLADNVLINSNIYVKVIADVIAPPEPETPEVEEEVAEKAQPPEQKTTEEATEKVPPPEQKTTETEKKAEDIIPDSKQELQTDTESPGSIREKGDPVERNTKYYSVSKAMLLSIPLPGLGLSRTTDKPHWIRGAVGYGCLAGAVYLHFQAVHTFDNIPNLKSAGEVEDAFNQSVRQDHSSEYLAYAAIGVWVTDLVWTYIGASRNREKSLSGESKGFSFGSSLDPLTFTPLVQCRFTF